MRYTRRMEKADEIRVIQQAEGWLRAAWQSDVVKQAGLGFDGKADESPVTATDKAVEIFLGQAIAEAFPDDGIQGEEGDAVNPAAARQWVIDPIDGTKAFMAGFHSFTSLLACVEDGRVVFGLMFQPGSGEMWRGSAEGSFWNGERNAVRACERLDTAFYSTTSPYYGTEHECRLVAGLVDETRWHQFGGDAFAYGQLARGRIDAVVEAGLKPHDFLALIPIIEQAGGVITDWQGDKLGVHSIGQVCAAGDARLHKQILLRLNG